MDEFNQSAHHAQDAVSALLAGAEEARARFADVRAQVATATERFDVHWLSVAERALHYLEQVARDEESLTASREETRQGLIGLRGSLEEVREHGPREVEHAQAGFDETADQVAQREPEMMGALTGADDAERALHSRLEAVQAEVDGAVAQTEEPLLQAAQEMEHFEREIERRVVQLNAFVSGECLPAVTNRAQDLYQRLVQAEEEVRGTLEAALEATESAADRALRDCRDGFSEALSDVAKLGEALDEVLFDVKVFLDAGRAKIKDRRESWDERVKSTREGLRDSLQLLKEVEAYLGHFGFGR